MIEFVVELEEAKELASILPENFESKFYWYKEKHHGVGLALKQEGLLGLNAFYTNDETRKGRKGKRIFSPSCSAGGWEWEFDYVVPAPIMEEMLHLLPDSVMLDKKQCHYKTTPNSVYYSYNSGKVKRINNIIDRSVFFYTSDSNMVEIPPNDCAKRISPNLTTAISRLYRWLQEETNNK